MADTSQQALSEPHTNGAVDGLTEEEKSKMRPADIDAVSSCAFVGVKQAQHGENPACFFHDKSLTRIHIQ